MSDKEENGYYADIARRLLLLCDEEVEIEDGEEKKQIHDLRNKLNGLKIHPDTVLPIMIEKGYLVPADKSPYPESFFLFPKAKQNRTGIYITTRTMRKLSQRLFKCADQAAPPAKGKFLSLEQIQSRLNAWRHDPDLLIPLMKAKGYLRTRSEKPLSYWIFPTQKQGQDF
jgi:hypothetical protein